MEIGDEYVNTVAPAFGGVFIPPNRGADRATEGNVAGPKIINPSDILTNPALNRPSVLGLPPSGTTPRVVSENTSGALLNRDQTLFLNTDFEKQAVIDVLPKNYSASNSLLSNYANEQIVEFDFYLQGIVPVEQIYLNFKILLSYVNVTGEVPTYVDFLDQQVNPLMVHDWIPQIEYAIGQTGEWNIVNQFNEITALYRKSLIQFTKDTLTNKIIKSHGGGAPIARNVMRGDSETLMPLDPMLQIVLNKKYEPVTTKFSRLMGELETIVQETLFNLRLCDLIPLFSGGDFCFAQGQRLQFRIHFARPLDFNPMFVDAPTALGYTPFMNKLKSTGNTLWGDDKAVVGRIPTGESEVQNSNILYNNQPIPFPLKDENLKITYNSFQANSGIYGQAINGPGRFNYYDMGTPIVIRGSNQMQFQIPISINQPNVSPAQAYLIGFRINDRKSRAWLYSNTSTPLPQVAPGSRQTEPIRLNDPDNWCGGFDIKKLILTAAGQTIYEIRYPSSTPTINYFGGVPYPVYPNQGADHIDEMTLNLEKQRDKITGQELLRDDTLMLNRDNMDMIRPFVLWVNPNPTGSKNNTQYPKYYSANMNLYLEIESRYCEVDATNIAAASANATYIPGLPPHMSLVVLPIINMQALIDANGKIIQGTTSAPIASNTDIQYPLSSGLMMGPMDGYPA